MLTDANHLSSSTPIEETIHQCDFLRLTTSKNYYPNSKGAGLPLIHLQTALCSAVIAIQGAQLLEFSTTGGKPLLWLSPNCDFTSGTALRGGVPICLPWFGPNTQDEKKPKHGFARNCDWQLHSATLLSNGDAKLIFTFISKANDLFAFDFCAELIMTLGTSAKLELKVSNTDINNFDCSWALHNYYSVSSLSDVSVKGLSNKKYLNKVENYAEKLQSGDIFFSGEVDRIFYGIENNLMINGTPSIAITHHNSPSVIVWNPGAQLSAKMSDIGAGNEQGYICVECGAVLNEKWNLKAGESRSAWVEFEETTNS